MTKKTNILGPHINVLQLFLSRLFLVFRFLPPVLIIQKMHWAPENILQLKKTRKQKWPFFVFTRHKTRFPKPGANQCCQVREETIIASNICSKKTRL